MRHYGDITKLSGYDLPIVDVITGGSPCQDLSIAGARKGMKHEGLGDGETTRSGLFMEQIRIVKEMRERERAAGRTGRYVRPRYMVWENVPGAFSSNGGKDFQAVLEEIVKIVEAEVPDLSDAVQGGWTKQGCLYSDVGQWSLAWRVHDAQYHGVPQRRKRICLLADFGGLTAPEILFDPQFERTTEGGEPVSIERDPGAGSGPEVQTVGTGLSGDSDPGGTAGEGTAPGTESGADEPVRDGWVESEGTYYDPGGNIFDRPDDDAICLQGNGIDRAETAGCNGKGWRRGGATPLTPSTDRQSSTISFQERAGKPGGGKGILIQREHTGALSTVNNQSVLDGGVHGGAGK